LKTLSTRMAPETMKPRFIMTRLTVGSMALGTTWCQRMLLLLRPLAWAVRT
jgi:hypothetical protein